VDTKKVGLTGFGLTFLLLVHLAAIAGAVDVPSVRKAVLPNGRPVTAEMFIRLGAPLQAELNGQWYAAQAIGLLADGNVKIHWVGLASPSDEILPRGRLMLAVDPLAGSAMVVQPKGPRMANKPQTPFVPLPNGPNGQNPVAGVARVEVLWGGKWWPAEVIETKDEKSYIRYIGFKDNWNEWVTPDRIRPVDANQAQNPQPAPTRPTRVTRAAMADMTLEQLIEVIKKRETFSMRDALQELNARRPDEPNSQVSKVLEDLVLGSDFSVAWEAAKPWEHWATEESVPGLLRAMENNTRFVTEPAMKALVRLKPEDAIEPMVEALGELGKADEAATILKAIGPKAEPALLEMIKIKTTKGASQENFTVGRACKILGEIGTSKSMPVLMALTNNFFTQRDANSAIQAIQSRSGKPPTKKKSK
jgi:hypothetical protein